MIIRGTSRNLHIFFFFFFFFSLPASGISLCEKKRKKVQRKMERRNNTIVSENVELTDELLKRACCLSMAAAQKTNPFVLDKPRNSIHAIFVFVGSWSITDWYYNSGKSFGDTKINKDDSNLFPSLRSIGNDEIAGVNEAFLEQFKAILRTSNLQNEVKRAVAEKRQLVFTGHSSGGSIAILAALWQFEQRRKQDDGNQIPPPPPPPLCITFGSPLIGDRVFGHALRREDWSRYFFHFVTQYDIVPRILFTPLPAIDNELKTILPFFNPKSSNSRRESIGRSPEALGLFSTVMKNTLSVTSHAACSFGCTNLLSETMATFIELSPYRPFGTFIFCAEKGKLIAVKNPDVILQLLFYSLQLCPGQAATEGAFNCLKEHLVYESKLQESLQMQDGFHFERPYFEGPEQLPLSSEAVDSDAKQRTDIAMNDLGLSSRARICLRAAGELEDQKIRNQKKIDENFSKIEEGLTFLNSYRAKCEASEVSQTRIGYYDAFKFQEKYQDFEANVKRLDLAGIWDAIIEMLKRYELPDDFESKKKRVDLGTKFRRLVEPLDIGNYYRHSKNNDSGPYMIKGRPKRYKYTQRWLEHADKVSTGHFSESTFWAEIEQLCGDASKNKTFEEVKERVLGVERDVLRWVDSGVLAMDVFFEETTFVKWWNTLPYKHRSISIIARLMNGEGRNLHPTN